MEHGRGHDERRYKAEKPRMSNVPGGEDDIGAQVEAEMAASGRHRTMVNGGSTAERAPVEGGAGGEAEVASEEGGATGPGAEGTGGATGPGAEGTGGATGGRKG